MSWHISCIVVLICHIFVLTCHMFVLKRLKYMFVLTCIMCSCSDMSYICSDMSLLCLLFSGYDGGGLADSLWCVSCVLWEIWLGLPNSRGLLWWSAVQVFRIYETSVYMGNAVCFRTLPATAGQVDIHLL